MKKTGEYFKSGLLLLIYITTVSLGYGQKYKANVPENITTPDVVQTSQLGKLRFFDGMPSEATVKKVYDNLDFARGVETFLTGIPAASQKAFINGMKEVGMGTYSMGIHEDFMDARALWLTPNTTVIYCIAEINVKDGPTVMEVPAGVLGPVNDAFFRWVGDIGFTGPDQGKGGKYLFTPPGYEGNIPEGYFVTPSKTFCNYVLMRAFVIDGDVQKTIAHVKSKWRLYPLAEADSQREPHFLNLSGLQYNTVHANDFGFYEELNEVVQYEPADAFDPELVGIWASIGIKKGKPFSPDERMKKILVEAAAVGNATARALSFKPRSREPYFFDDRQWYTAFVGGSYEFMNQGERMLDYRTFMHYVATGITPAMSQSEVGKGSAYLFTGVDAQGKYLDGGNTYKVTLPGPVPAKDFWSFVVYSGQHRSLLETDQKSAGVDSNSPDLKANEDGSYTVWFGPKSPVGKEGNWVQTMPGKSWNVLLRLYGPLEPWINKTWKPGDFELVMNANKSTNR
jgi:hypothetical protein